MHLIALVESEEHVCCRFRLTAFRRLLAQAGHTLRCLPLPRHWWQCWPWRQELRGATVVLQRRLLPRWQLAWMRALVRHLLYDIDDAVFLRDSYSAKGLHHAGRLRRFAATVRAADGVIAGNEFLKDQAARWLSPERITIIPTCVEVARHPLANHQRTSGSQLVWIGSSSTLQGLERVQPLLEQIGVACPGTTLKLVCDRFLELKHLPIERCVWSEAIEGAALASADVGISWIPDDLWSRGKCGLKVLQYMAAGLPVVANPVGVHPGMIEHGETGFLAETPAQWVTAIRTLSANPALRRQMGARARRAVEQRYSVEAGGQRWVEVLHHLEQSGRRATA